MNLLQLHITGLWEGFEFGLENMYIRLSPRLIYLFKQDLMYAAS
jgi:hypothetical protein